MTRKKIKKGNRNYLVIFILGIAVIGFFIMLNMILNPAAPVEDLISGNQQRDVQSENDVPRVELKDAKSAFDKGIVVFIDTRSLGSFTTSHIPGALSIEFPEIEDETADLDKNGLYITYCT